MLISVQEDETRIALTEDNQIIDLHIEQTNRERTVGNIYKGVVAKVNPAFQAAFVEYGEGKNGFLSISDINHNLFGGSGDPRGRKIQSVLKSGQEILVQVIKEGVRHKGASLSTYISLPGRYLVLTPQTDRSGVSRKIENPEVRSRLKEILSQLTGAEEDLGVIIRTVGISRSPVELKRDLASLKKDWSSIDQKFKTQKNPGLLHQEASNIVRVLRDYFNDTVSEVWVDSPEAFQEALLYFKANLPKNQKRLKLYVGDKSLFSAYGMEEKIEALDSSKVNLRSGGSIVIESTEALVSIDVNSGRSNQASDIETTALNTNMEAAEEIARQLRLRNLGGLIVVDYIDMSAAKNREKVEKKMETSLQNDKARTTVGSISQFGLLELSRQRIAMELSRGLRKQCLHCEGTGHVPTVHTSANNVLRKIRELAASGKTDEIQGTLPLEHANFILNHRREQLQDLELEFEISIHLFGDPDMPEGQSIHLSSQKNAALVDDEEATEDSPSIPRAVEESGDDIQGRKRKRRRRRGRGDREETNGESPQMVMDDLSADASAPEKSEPKDSVIPFQRPARSSSPQPVRELEAVTVPMAKLPRFEKSNAALVETPYLSAKRGGWLKSVGANSSSGDVLFASTHPGAENMEQVKLFGHVERSNPFADLAGGEDEILFDSSGALEIGKTSPDQTPSIEMPAKKEASETKIAEQTGAEKPAAVKKTAATKTGVKKPAATKKPAAKTAAAKTTEGKTTAKKPAAKKPAAKKAAAKPTKAASEKTAEKATDKAS